MENDYTDAVQFHIEMAVRRALDRKNPTNIGLYINVVSPVRCTYTVKETKRVIDTTTQEHYLRPVAVAKISFFGSTLDTLLGVYIDQEKEDRRKPWWKIDWL